MLLVTGCSNVQIGLGDGWSGPVVDQGVIYLGTRDGSLIGVEASSLQGNRPIDIGDDSFDPLWTVSPSKEAHAVYSTPVLSASRVFYAQNTGPKRDIVGNVHAIRRGGEREIETIWSFETKGAIFGSPVLHKGVLYVADDAGFVYALEASSSPDYRELWSRQVGEKRFWSTPTLSEGTLYIGSMDKWLYALDAENGSEKWKVELGGAIASTPLVSGRQIYVGAFDQHFYAFDRQTGEEVWAFQGDGWFWNDAIHSADGHTVFVGSLGGSFYAIRTQDEPGGKAGTARWVNEIGTKVRASPLLVGGRLYVLSRGGQLLTLNPESGRSQRTEILGARALASPVWSQGSLFIYDLDQNLHRYEIEGAPDAGSQSATRVTAEPPASPRDFSTDRRIQVDRLVCLAIQELMEMADKGIKSSDDVERNLLFVADYIEIASVSSASAELQTAVPLLRTGLEAGNVPAFYDALRASDQVCKKVGAYESAASR
ncbi:PQQ-binding-like beta-propeller repeat protein [Dehalococcoidia bacterium]|nr:PQQ-binding-like beta-propeller repeat protein [Dehalococcoidia bacterium]